MGTRSQLAWSMNAIRSGTNMMSTQIRAYATRSLRPVRCGNGASMEVPAGAMHHQMVACLLMAPANKAQADRPPACRHVMLITAKERETQLSAPSRRSI